MSYSEILNEPQERQSEKFFSILLTILFYPYLLYAFYWTISKFSQWTYPWVSAHIGFLVPFYQKGLWWVLAVLGPTFSFIGHRVLMIGLILFLISFFINGFFFTSQSRPLLLIQRASAVLLIILIVLACLPGSNVSYSIILKITIEKWISLFLLGALMLALSLFYKNMHKIFLAAALIFIIIGLIIGIKTNTASSLPALF